MKDLQKKPYNLCTTTNLSPKKESKTERYLKDLSVTLGQRSFESKRIIEISPDQAVPFSQSKHRSKRLEETKDRSPDKKSDRCQKYANRSASTKKLILDPLKQSDTDSLKRDESLAIKSECMQKTMKQNDRNSTSEMGQVSSRSSKCSTVRPLSSHSNRPEKKSSCKLKAQSEVNSSDRKAVNFSITNTHDSGIDTFKQLDSENYISSSPCKNAYGSDHGTMTMSNSVQSKDCSLRKDFLFEKEVKPKEADTVFSQKTMENFEIFYKQTCEKYETKKHTEKTETAVCEEHVSKVSNQHQPNASPKLSIRNSPVSTPRKSTPRIPSHKEIELEIEDVKPEDLVAEISEKDGNAIIRITPRQSFEDSLQPSGCITKTSNEIQPNQNESNKDSRFHQISETKECENSVNHTTIFEQKIDSPINLLLETPKTQNENSPQSDICFTRKLSPVFEEDFILDTLSERSVSERTSQESYCDPFNRKLVDRITTISKRLGACFSNENQDVPPKSDNIYDKVTQSETISYFVTTTSSDITLKSPEKQLERKMSTDCKFKRRSFQETECVLNALSKQLSQLRNQSQREYFEIYF